MFNKLQKLLLQIHRSKGAFKVHRWEEEEELFSVHVRFFILIWLSLVLSIEMIREMFFPQLSPMYEPFILAGFIIIYHFVWVRGKHWIWAVRAFYLILPLFMFLSEENREEGAALLHQMEVSLLDKGIDFWHFGSYMEPGFKAEIIFAAFLLWGIMIYYEIGKRKEIVLCLFPIFFFVTAVLFLGWETPWWVCPLLFAQMLLLYMPSFFAWGVFACVGGCCVIVISRLPVLQKNTPSAVYQKWESWRYDSGQPVLPDGDMTKVWNLVRNDQVELNVESASDGPYYLKGFVGAFYDGENSWNHDRTTARNIEQGVFGSRYDIIDLLGDRGFYGNNILMNHSKIRKTKSLKFRVTNINASRKYLYLPYESKTKPSAFLEQASLSVGEMLLSKGIRGQTEYECNVISSLAGKTKTVMSVEQAGNSTEEEKERSTRVKSTGKIYEDYRNRVYLALPKSTRTLITDVLDDSNAPKSVSLANTVSFIRSFMQANIAYTEQAAPIPKGKEFLSWFLEEEKKGNDIYYAACGTLLFRYYGIPARYVEGYIYSSQDTEGEKEVLASDAHAWTEIYVENLGWIPIELCEKYETMIPSYLPVENSVSSSVPESEEEEENEEKAEEDTEEIEETVPEEQNTAAGGQLEEKNSNTMEAGKNTAASDVLSTVFHWGKIFLGAVFLLGIFLFTMGAGGGLLWYWIRESRWQRIGSSSACIVEWYRHVMMCLYLLEDIKEISFDEWDNRNTTLRKLLQKHDEGFEGKALEECLFIYQIALFSPKSISWNQRKQFVLLFRQTRKRLKRKLKVIQRLRLIYDRNFY